MPELAKKSSHDVSTFKIIIEEQEVDPSEQVLSITITKELNRISMATIIIRDGEASEQTFSVSEEGNFIPGKKIKLVAGRDGDNAVFFKGLITRQAIRIKENGDAEIHVECRDEAVRMTIGRKSRYYEKGEDKKVIEQLAKLNKVKAQCEDTKLNHKELVQHNISDWDFLLLRAEANGMLVSTEDGLIKVFKPNTDAAPVAELVYGTDILELVAEMDGTYQFKNIVAESWDFANQKVFKSETASVKIKEAGNVKGSDIATDLGPEKFLLHHGGFRLEQELKDWADGFMIRSRLAKIRGRARVTGTDKIKPGNMIKLEGIGARFNGNVFVTAVRHEILDGTWQTDIQFGLDPARYAERHNNDMNERQASGLVGSIHGLQVGKAVKLENDPDGQDRILVRLPTIDNNGQGIWTRVASLDAGNERGAYFRPELGDEVIVGFINDDPRDAVMLGMLHSGQKPSPIKAADANDEKGFTTRSKMHISFNDSTKTITIDTPQGNKIVLDEGKSSIEIQDQNQNKLVMKPAGITMESNGNIDITAAQVLTLKGGTSLSIGGPSISMKADGNVSIEGAMAKLAAQGPNEITGLPVKIN